MVALEPQQNRYLWVHLLGLAAVPVLLDICMAGLASAGPAMPWGPQFWLVAGAGIVPTLAMQWLRPFYVFSLPPLALKPDALSEDWRRCLRVVASWQVKALSVAAAALSLWALAKLYEQLPKITPLVSPATGLFVAVVSFFFVCLFLQISASVLRSLLVSPTALQRVTPYEVGAIASDFSILGWQVQKILPAPAVPESPDLESPEPEPPEPELPEPELPEPEPTAPDDPAPSIQDDPVE